MGYLGGKTLAMEEPELLGFTDPKATAYFRVVKDILEELNRRIWNVEDEEQQHYIGVVTASATDDYWYECDMYRLDKDGTAVDLELNCEVKCLNDAFEEEETLSATFDHQIWCSRLTPDLGASSKYAGVSLFGRATIGLC